MYRGLYMYICIYVWYGRWVCTTFSTTKRGNLQYFSIALKLFKRHAVYNNFTVRYITSMMYNTLTLSPLSTCPVRAQAQFLTKFIHAPWQRPPYSTS